MKIYDCFNFFNELDILDLRLNILSDYVDYFVLVESSITHSGVPKPFFYEQNKFRFREFEKKIIHYKVFDTPSDFLNLKNSEDPIVTKINQYIETQTNRFNRLTQIDYGRDFFQKECVRRPLSICDDDDIIMISDADEIPNPKLLKKIQELDLDNKIYSLNQKTYYYYLNVLKQDDWYGTKLSKFKNIKNLSFNEIRGDEKLSSRISNGGWHFSFMGGKEMVLKKILSYSARDHVNSNVILNLQENIDNDVDPFFRGKLQIVKLDETYPEYLLNNIEKYKLLIK